MTGNTSDAKIRQDLEELLGRYKELASSKSLKEMKEFSEANVRANFIDPLFKILGWKTDDMNEYSRESYIPDVGFADIEIKLNDEPKVFVEAKRFGGIPHIRKRGDADWTMEERQVILYAASRNCRWAVLTNFEKLRVYNALTGLTILNFESVYDLTDRFRELLYLTKHSVETGRIEKLADKEEKPDIDIEFLKLLNNWRISLANDIYQRNRDNGVLKDDNGELDLEKLKDAVQRILDRIVIIRWAEDNLVVDDPYLLGRKLDEWKVSPIYNSIVDSLFGERALFNKFDKIHDGKIFERGHICEQVEIGDDVLGGIIQEMNQRSFRKFDFDILGNTYETYLGNTLYLKDDGTLGLKPGMESRKESGIYYTPPYVVDYIVQNTLGELLKDKTPEEVSKIKVLDPACGSGSFLIKAYDYFKDYYEKENEKIHQQKERLIEEIRQANGSQMNFENNETYEFKEHRGFEQEILRNNIHGVDLDRQAAEIASVNLMLKALKPGERLPPILGENIKVGNSLISGTEDELREYFAENWEKMLPFNWDSEFHDVFNQSGFDIVIGNPPYFKMEGRREEQNYFKATTPEIYRGKNDVYYYFLVKGINILKDNGILGFIVERYFFEATYADKLRKIITDCTSIKIIIDFGDVKIFPDAGNHTCIILLKKGKSENNLTKIVKVKKGMICDDSQFFNTNEILMNHILKYIDELNYEDEYVEIFNLEQNNLGMEQWILTSEINQRLLNKIKDNSCNLNELCEIEQGQKSGLNEAFKVTDKEITDYKLERDLLKKLIKNSDIKRYQINWEGNYLIYTSDYTEIEKYPNISNYFNSFKDKLMKRAEVNENKYSWFRLQRPRRQELFDVTEKIVVPYRAPENRFAYDSYQCYNDGGDIRVIVPRKNISVDLKYILGLLNSKIINYYYKSIGRPKGDVFEYFVEPLSKIPIHKIDFSNPSEKSTHDEIIVLVDCMLDLNRQLKEIPADFWHHVNLQPHNMIALRRFINELSVSDKEVLKDHFGKPVSTIEVKKIEAFNVIEDGEWLIFNVGYKYKGSKGKIMNAANVNALRIKIQDNNVRKFILYSLKDTTPGKLGKGNILKQIQKLKIPNFVTNEIENTKIIQEFMTPFLEQVAKREQIEKEITETDKTIDQMVYKLYGLNEKEIAIVEESMTS